MNRTDTLTALVKISIPTSEAILQLAEFPWDSETELVHLAKNDFFHVLSLFKQGTLSAAEVEDWANAIEGRDDVGFTTSQLHELLHELANPLLTEPLSGERADFWLSMLSNGR
jgi:hypothetical protein